jgi:4a-hydroxytetrahydrobiopterin dehydratase
MGLAEEKCNPCRTDTPPLSSGEIQALLIQTPQWKFLGKHIEREFTFKDFKQAMNFVNRLAEIADEMDHHPDIFISYNRVHLTLWTHKIDGLSRNDFILAARIDTLLK